MVSDRETIWTFLRITSTKDTSTLLFVHLFRPTFCPTSEDTVLDEDSQVPNNTSSLSTFAKLVLKSFIFRSGPSEEGVFSRWTGTNPKLKYWNETPLEFVTNIYPVKLPVISSLPLGSSSTPDLLNRQHQS